MDKIESSAAYVSPPKGAEAAASHSQPAKPDPVAASQDASKASSAGQYISPVIKVDNNSGLAILQVRNGQTGETEQQYPSNKVVREYSARETPNVPASPEQATASSDSGNAPAGGVGGTGTKPNVAAEAAQSAQGAPAEKSSAPQTGGASANVSLIA